MIISDDVIRKTIEEGNYLPDEANYLISDDFKEKYAPSVLNGLTDKAALLNKMFGPSEQESLTWFLEYNEEYIKPLYGQARSGNNEQKILNFSAEGKWKTYKESIAENDAQEKAAQIWEELASVFSWIEKNPNASAVDIGRELRKKDNIPHKEIWLKKYLCVLYPDKFMPMVNDDWTHRIFSRIEMNVSDDWYENSAAFAKKAADLKVDFGNYNACKCVALYHAVFKPATEQMLAELAEKGITREDVPELGDLLINKQKYLKAFKGNIRKKSQKTQAKYKKIIAALDEYLPKKFKWNDMKTETIKPQKSSAEAAPSVESQATMYQNEYSKKLLASKNIILRGAPGTGKTFLAREIAADIVSGGQKTLYDSLTDEEKMQVGFVQFHPSYDYSDFVEGLRPVKKSDDPNGIGFECRDGIFKEFADRARGEEESGKNYVFIIDEINRGEISKILGELFFAIDPGYRGKKGEVTTQYANMHDDPAEKFYVPENLYIIGTMNDIDRSVDTFDFAMRRRFRFIEIDAKDRIGMLDDLDDDLEKEAVARMDSLNEKISEILNSNYHVGPAYFRKLGEVDFKFEDLWSDYLDPLLHEYVSGMPEETEHMKDLKAAYDGPNVNHDEVLED